MSQIMKAYTLINAGFFKKTLVDPIYTVWIHVTTGPGGGKHYIAAWVPLMVFQNQLYRFWGYGDSADRILGFGSTYQKLIINADHCFRYGYGTIVSIQIAHF